MPQYKMEIDLRRCVGCGVCAMACKLGNNTRERYGSETFNWADIAVDFTGTASDGSTRWLAVPSLCNHCESPKCVSVCPVAPDANGRRAIFKDVDTGIVMHNNDRCIHCYQCKQNCPYSIGYFNPAATAKYSVISTNYEWLPDTWANTTALWTDCTATPAQVVTQVGGVKPPHRTKWTHVENLGGIDYTLYDVRLPKKPEKCYYCYHRLQDTSLTGIEPVWGEDTSGPNTGWRKPYCVLACPAKARRLTTDAIPEGAKVLQHGSPTTLTLVDAGTYAPAHSRPQTYYINSFSP